MLQRAASNAYSWWWASHIRTKQSKWMEQNLQDMEEKVQVVLKLLEEEGDSFAKRAEMYYKRRPELISFVEETFRAYRSLADRYDHLSTELQNANNTIASVCPDRVPYMDEEDDEGSPRKSRKKAEFKPTNVPKVPKPPMKDLKSVITTATKKLKPQRYGVAAATPKPPRSGLTRKEAIGEVDKLQKQILSLQTVKEFLKSSYDNSISKYWETEEQIKELQEKLSNLQDELGEGVIIDDEVARRLMAEAALKSCQDALSQLEVKQAESLDETKVETKRVKEVREKLSSLMNEANNDQANTKNPRPKKDAAKAAEETEETEKELNEEIEKMAQQRQELQIIQDKIKEHFDAGSDSDLTVSDMAEKIDELVTKVVSLESSVSSQNALVKRLKVETDELNSMVKTLESDKESLINDKEKLNQQLREMDEKLKGLQNLKHTVVDQNTNLQTHFTEAHCNLDNLSEKVQKPEEVGELAPSESKSDVKEQAALLNDAKSDVGNEVKVAAGSQKLKKTKKGKDDTSNNNTIKSRDAEIQHNSSKKEESSIKHQEKDSKQTSSLTEETTAKGGDSQEKAKELDDEAELRQKERDSALLAEYANTLKNYEEVKSKLAEVEKKSHDAMFESSLQLKELKTSNAMKDEEIRLLRQKLSLLHENLDGDESFEETRELARMKTTAENRDIEEMLKLEEPETEISAIEEKFRTDIDELLEENLEFWMKFSTSFTEIQKFETTTKDLLIEVKQIDEKWKSLEGSSSIKYSLKSDARPLYKHLSEIQNDLTVWLENSVMLKEELQSRFSSLCGIQEEITAALKASAEDEDFKFTSYQAAKFQGEVLNMKQENNKVADELQAGLDLVTTLQLDSEKALGKLNERFGLSNSKRNPRRPPSDVAKNGVPLRSFIFGVKPKKQKQSIFSCMTPAMHKKYRALK